MCRTRMVRFCKRKTKSIPTLSPAQVVSLSVLTIPQEIQRPLLSVVSSSTIALPLFALIRMHHLSRSRRVAQIERYKSMPIKMPLLRKRQIKSDGFPCKPPPHTLSPIPEVKLRITSRTVTACNRYIRGIVHDGFSVQSLSGTASISRKLAQKRKTDSFYSDNCTISVKMLLCEHEYIDCAVRYRRGKNTRQ